MTSFAAFRASLSVVAGRQRSDLSPAAAPSTSAPCATRRPFGQAPAVHETTLVASECSVLLCTSRRRAFTRSITPRAAEPWAPGPASPESKPDPFATKEVYSDSDPVSKFMLWYFSKVMSQQLGNKPFDGTYESFVELSREIMRGRNTKQQQETVASVLGSLLPPQSPERFRQWFPLSRRNAEFNAWITTLGFTWLVGPSELENVEIEFQGNKEIWRSGVKIIKCRYLENSGCVGMCVNMCKIPTQKFFTDTFGLPLTMNPDFETLSCEMIFGQAPPPVEQDPVYNQPCLSVCNLGRSNNSQTGVDAPPCTKIDTERKFK